MKHAIPNTSDGGCIINIASVMGLTGWIGTAVYGSTKAAIIQMTKTAALELVPRKIRVNAVCLGRIATPMVAHLTDPKNHGNRNEVASSRKRRQTRRSCSPLSFSRQR